MPVEKFSIPSNFTLLQSLELLHSIVANRLENYQHQKSSLASNSHNISATCKLLDELLAYLQEGIRKIERYYNCHESLSNACKGKGELQVKSDDLKIVGQEIRLARKDCRNRLEILGRQEQGSRSKGLSLSSIWRNHSKRDKSKVDKEEEAAIAAAEKIKEARQLEERKKLAELERLEKEQEAQREKMIETKIRQQVESELTSRLKEEKRLQAEKNRQKTREEEERRQRQQKAGKSSYPDKHSLVVNGRRSLDIRPSFRRSLDDSSTQPLRKSLDMQDIGRAAQLAWTQSQQKAPRINNPLNLSLRRNNPASTSNPQSPTLPSASANTRKRYEYTQPVITRQQIKAPKKANLPSKDASKEVVHAEQRSKKESVIVKRPPTMSKSAPSGSGSPTPPSTVEREGTPGAEDNEDNLSPMERRINKVMSTLHGVDVQECEQIKNEILVINEEVHWDDIAGLTRAKSSLKEAVVYPFLRPDLFKGLREPIRGMLLFGPPGTGKTMIAKAVATESKSTFFSISASSLLSKYLGESEKLVRALFYLAKRLAPSIIFVDEIDSLLTARSDNENESSRRIKTELLIQWSALSSATANENKNSDNRVLVLAATNLPWAIDEAARRRFSRRLYIPLPEYETRLYHLKKLLSKQKNELSDTDFEVVAEMCAGFSGSDITALAKEAAMEPIRDLGDTLVDADFNKIRGVTVKDFEKAMQTVKRSVSPDSLQQYQDWAAGFGSTGA